MKTVISLAIFYALSFMSLGFSTPHYSSIEDSSYFFLCKDRGDSAYNRVEILQKFADIVNKQFDYNPAKINNSNSLDGFFIHDLVDLTNFDIGGKRKRNNCIQFFEGHIYHFSPKFFPYSFSNIAFLNKGNLVVFKAVNCIDRGNNFQEALDYILPFLKGSPNEDEITDNLLNYREYGSYVAPCFESYKLDCKCESCRE